MSSIPKIRFKGFTDDWEKRKLGDFGKATGGTSIESEFSEDGILTGRQYHCLLI